MTGTPRTCREGVLEAFHRLEGRHGRQVFKVEDIVAETRTLGSWQDSTIRTHVCSHMSRTDRGRVPELERVGDGLYRRRPSAAVDIRVDLVSEDIGEPEGSAAFERRARAFLSERWAIELASRVVTLTGGVRKSFDLVSENASIVGDAKWYKDLPNPKGAPAAKWSTIAEYVWLLQHPAPNAGSWCSATAARSPCGGWIVSRRWPPKSTFSSSTTGTWLT